MFRRVLQPFYTGWAVLWFTITFFLVFPVYLLLGLLPTDKSARAMVSLTGWWARAWLLLVGMQLQKLGAIPYKGRYVIVSNHISYLDTVNIFAAIPFFFRPLGKKEMSHIPLFGRVYGKVAIMVDRQNPESRAASLRSLHHVLQEKGSVLLFPEGTFNEGTELLKSFYDGAFRLAITAQAPILPIVFPDTVYRWHYKHWYQLWPGRNRAIFLEPIPVEGYSPDDVDLLKQITASHIAKTLASSR